MQLSTHAKPYQQSIVMTFDDDDDDFAHHTIGWQHKLLVLVSI